MFQTPYGQCKTSAQTKLGFNQNINGWETSSAENMAAMFDRAAQFNQRLDSWTTDHVRDMSWMFSEVGLWFACSAFAHQLHSKRRPVLFRGISGMVLLARPLIPEHLAPPCLSLSTRPGLVWR